MTLTVTVQVPDHAPAPAEIVAIDLNAAGAAVASQRTLVLPGMLSTFHPHRTRTMQVIEAGYRAIRPDLVLDGRAIEFGEALQVLKAGGRITRAGWNGRGMFLLLVPGSTGLTVDEGRPLAKAGIPVGTRFNYLPHIDMWTARGDFVPWLPSQADMLAEDWMVLPQIAEPVIEHPAGAPALPASSR